MRRWPAILALLVAGPVAAQDRPVELPPLLTPSQPAAPAVSPKGPRAEYDHAHLYLPETAPIAAPQKPPEEARPLGRWWLNPSLEFGWATEVPTMRLRVPLVRGGPAVPLEGVSADSFRFGFDLTGGVWLDESRRNALDSGSYLLANSSTAGPGTLASWFVSADVNYRRRLIDTPAARLDAVAGYRFGAVADELYLGDATDDASKGLMVSNRFHGGQVGLIGSARSGAWSVGAEGKVAVGGVRTEVNDGGFGTPRTAVLPTATATVGRHFGDDCRVFVGYSFYYLNRVARLGDAVGPEMRYSDFWAQAVKVGLELRY